MDDFDFDPEFPALPPRIAKFIADPDARRWAHDCGWVPGTGSCKNRPCSPECLFREERETEASRIEHQRRHYRRSQHHAARTPRRLN